MIALSSEAINACGLMGIFCLLMFFVTVFLIGRYIPSNREHTTRGRVKWFNDSKGFGFITTEDGTDVFVHHSEIRSSGYRTLEEGEPVEFEVEMIAGKIGPLAKNVHRIWPSQDII